MRRTKLILLLGGLLWLAAWVAWGSQAGLATAWAVAGAGIVLAYGACGWLSYRGPRARWTATGLSALLAAIVVFVSFFHVGLLAGGLAVTLGCALPAR